VQHVATVIKKQHAMRLSGTRLPEESPTISIRRRSRAIEKANLNGGVLRAFSISRVDSPIPRIAIFPARSSSYREAVGFGVE